jgi:hypothetical protein
MEEKTQMKLSKRIPVVALLLVCFLCFAYPNAANAAATPVTNQATFVSDLATGYYLETFSELPQTADPANPTPLSAPIDFTGGAGNAFAYNAVSVVENAGLLAVPFTGTPSGLATFAFGDTLGFNFTSGNVTAVGGQFFSADVNGILDPLALVQVVLNDGSTVTLPAVGNSPTNFEGFLITTPGLFITSLQITPYMLVGDDLVVNGNESAAVSNLYVGDYQAATNGGTAPEPATFVLLGAGLIAGGLLRKRLSRV